MFRVRENEKQYHYGDIYWVKGPTKYFPAVIASKEKFNRGRNVIIIPLTRKLDRRKYPAHSLMKAVGTSVALPEDIKVIDKSNLGDFICHATEKEKDHLDMCMVNIIGDMQSLIGTVSTPGSYSVIGTPNYFRSGVIVNDEKFKFGDIYWLDLPETAESETNIILKRRPCVIISQGRLPNNKLIVIPMTTNLGRKNYRGHALMKANETSVILPEQIKVIKIDSLGDYIGHATDKELHHLKISIASIFGSITRSIGYIRN